MAHATAILTPDTTVQVRQYTAADGGPAASLNFDDTSVIVTTTGYAPATAAEIVAAMLVLRAACDEVIAANSPKPAPDGLEFIGTVGQFLDYMRFGNAPESELRALAGDR